MIAPSNAHGGAATPEEYGRSQSVAMFAAESQKFAITFAASHGSGRPQPVASTFAVFDCTKGG